MIVLPALSSVNDILDNDLILVEHSTGEGFKMTGADLKNFINAQATDTVALNNMHSVTSNAVAKYIKNLSGSFSVTIAANGYTNQGIAFGETLPNKNYVVQYRAVGAGSILFTEINRETTGSTVNVRNLNDSQLTITCEWYLICKG